METDFLSLKDEPFFSPIYNSGMLEDTEGSLLGIIKDEFPYGSSFWDTEPELSNSPNSSTFASMQKESEAKEDFQKMLTDWQEHLGSLQDTDNDDIEMSINLGRQMVSQTLPDTIFDGEVTNSVNEPSTSRSLLKPKRERLGKMNSSPLYGMKVGGRDARLPLMEDSEDSVLLPPPTTNSINMDQLDEDDCIDIETVSEQNPVLEAGDLKSLLEQFEASEAVNSNASNQQVESMSCPLPRVQQQLASQSNNSPPLALVLSHQKIREALPKEVIDKIKASSRKKLIPLIPAMPSKKLAKGTRMQDAAAALSRNKLLKLVTGCAGDTVQLDHDYCTTMDSSHNVNFYHCDAKEYLTREENSEHCAPNSPKVATITDVDMKSANDGEMDVEQSDCWDEKNAKKDSGLESGEVSDASEEFTASKLDSEQPQAVKKKLNLQEYRSRREEMEKQRAATRHSDNTHLASVDGSAASEPVSPVATSSKPEMHSVEVQTQDISTESEKSHNRDHRSRRYRSRRSSGHGSTSSNSSCSPNWQRYSSPSSRHRCRARHSLTAGSSANQLAPLTSDTSSRSPSVSRSSCSSSPSRSRSRSRASDRHYRGYSQGSNEKTRRASSTHSGWSRRSCSPRSVTSSGSSDWQLTERERQRQVEERRVIYVGRLPEGTSKIDLRKRFEVFGPILDISVHFREHGDNYGFVTFAYKVDAYDAVEHGNEDPNLPVYDLCFGGRRTFCKVRYSDLDAQAGGSSSKVKGPLAVTLNKKQESFDRLLREAQAKLHKRGKL